MTESNDFILSSRVDYTEFSGLSYLLATAEDLVALKDSVINDGRWDAADECGLWAYHGYYFKLTKDIDMTGVEWTPFNFNGTFDGAGHTISNMQMNENFFESADPANNEYKSAEYEAAFFGQVVHATIKNLYFKNCTAKISDCLDPENQRDIYVGIVAATAIASSFENVSAINCTVIQNGKDDNFAYSGGLVGYADICHFEYCSFDGTITTGGDATGSQNVGGLVGGWGDMYYEFIADYDNPYNMVVGAGKDFGIYNCFSTAEIVNPYFDSSAGILGFLCTDYISATFENCAFGGKINAGGRASGIIGEAEANDIYKNCVVYAEEITTTDRACVIGMYYDNNASSKYVGVDVTDCKISSSTVLNGTKATLLNGLTPEALAADAEKIVGFKSNLYGKLADGSGNVTITLSQEDAVKYTATTDADGEYNFGKQVLPGSYTLKIAEGDYKAVEEVVEISYAANVEKNITRVANHRHNWGYSASGAVISATCNNSNCGVTTDPTLTLAVSMSNNAPVVSVTPNATWTTENNLTVLTVSDVKYVDSSSEESSSVPTAAGAYTAKITVNGEIASVAFEILDYTGIDTAISSVPVDMSNYTDETVNAVNAAKTAAETAKSSAATQAELNSAATALTNAINALALKPADYTAVDTALATVPADLSAYTAETKAAVEAALAAVVRGKDITEQATVTGYATAIENAVAALITELRSAEITVIVPAKGDTPTTSAANGTGYTVGALSWNGSPEVFLGSTEYTVTFTLTAADKYVFASNAAVTVPGAKDGGVSAVVAQDGKTVSVTATFPATLAKGVTSIVIKTMPTDTDYTYGDAFDPTGLVLTVSYDDSSVEDVTYNDETNAAFSFGSELNVATTAVTVTYGGKDANVTVTVAPKELTITVANKSVYVGSQKPDLSTAISGTDYTVSGLVDGDSITVALSYVTEPDMNKAGEYGITAAGTDASGNYTITVVNGKLKVSYYPVYPDPTYTPTVDDTTGGDTTVSDKNPEKGDKVTITTDPDKGYEVGEITVTDSRGNEVEVIDNGDGTFTYVQPVGKVTITVTYVCSGTHNCPSLSYSDLNTSLWYHSATDYVIENGLMNGIGNNLFDPNGTTSRAMIVTILWRLEGEPVANYLMQFEDVPAETWYTEAVRWAASEKIVEGYGDTFGPSDAITREQFATILWRYAKYKGYDVSVGENTNILSYEDAFGISEWAIPAMQWACGAGLMQGDGVNLTPKADATRVQAAALFQRFCENVAEK